MSTKTLNFQAYRLKLPKNFYPKKNYYLIICGKVRFKLLMVFFIRDEH